MKLEPERERQWMRVREADPDAWESTFRRMVLYDFGHDMRIGFFASYYRSFTVPRISKVLADTGEIKARPSKRSMDTALVIYEIIANGFESPRAQHMVDLLRRLHKDVPGSNADFLYILFSLLVVPMRWVERFGWRPVEDSERAAATRFFVELGRRMGLKDIPDTFDAASKFFDCFEKENVRFAPQNADLVDATIHMLADRFPWVLRGLVRPMLSFLIGDPRVCEAVGLARPNKIMSGLIRAALWLRNLRTRRSKPEEEPNFIPGTPRSTVYTSGYALDDIGPVGHR